uniref:Uncharacterized protein n=1 Tax=Kalanchoe fedtschenkoi TaxID=63787 RepID=A0A7N0V703_KALFE
MASRAVASKVKSLALPRNRTFATHAPPFQRSNLEPAKSRAVVRADQVPIYMILGMAAVAASLGIYTATHQVLHSPTVRVSKKKRETLPEVEDPGVVVSWADKFVNKSLFRKLAHLKEHYHRDPSRYVESLENIGGDSKLRS